MSTDVVDVRRFVRSFRWELLAGATAVAVLFWAWWPTLGGMVNRWANDAQYSHGFLVPLFSLYLLWARRGMLARGSFKPNWWGLALLSAGLALRFAGTYTFITWLPGLALLPTLAGLCVLAGGWRALAWAWPAIAFLVFMLPMPNRLESALGLPLQRVATVCSTYALQTLGFAASSEGNIIRMGTVRLGVVEACSGLAMLVSFFALSTAVALVIRRPLLERSLIFLSAAPIAVISNVLRITVTGILHKTAGAHLANLVFHDLAGWLMMPVALGMLWCELKLLSRVLLPAPKRDDRPITAMPFLRHGKAATGPKVPARAPARKDKPVAATPTPPADAILAASSIAGLKAATPATPSADSPAPGPPATSIQPAQ